MIHQNILIFNNIETCHIENRITSHLIGSHARLFAEAFQCFISIRALTVVGQWTSGFCWTFLSRSLLGSFVCEMHCCHFMHSSDCRLHSYCCASHFLSFGPYLFACNAGYIV